MGAPNAESNQAPSVMKPQCDNTNNAGEIRINSLTAVDQFSPEKKLISFTSSSSSSASSPDSWQDPFLDFYIKHEDSTLSTDLPPKLDDNSELIIGVNGQSGNDNVVTDHRPPKPSSNHITTERPPTQVMERPCNSPYRIPSSVFRTKSISPGEWSMASNDSLFSIQMGGMSFKQDPIFWRSGELAMLSKSGELGMLSETGELDMLSETGELGILSHSGEIGMLSHSGELDMLSKLSTSSPFLSLPDDNQQPNREPPSDNQPSNNKPIEECKSYELGMSVNSVKSTSGENAAEASKNSELDMTVETTKSVSRDNAEDQPSMQSGVEERTSHFSAESGSSSKSFAFPVLAGETDKLVSAKMGASVIICPEQQETKAETGQDSKADAQTEAKTEQQPSELEKKASAAYPASSCTTWFPCFKCCAPSS